MLLRKAVPAAAARAAPKTPGRSGGSSRPIGSIELGVERAPERDANGGVSGLSVAHGSETLAPSRVHSRSAVDLD